MGFRSNAFATVWETKTQSDRWTRLRISISRKNPQTNEYETDFSGWVDCYGSSVAAKAAKLKEKDRIKILSCDISNKYDKEKNTTYWNPKIFDFEMAGSSSTGSGQRSSHAASEGENDDDGSDLPF